MAPELSLRASGDRVPNPGGPIRKARRTARVRISTLLLLAPLLGVCVLPAHGDGEPQVDPDGYTRAAVCGSCHQDIYRTWRRSLHALSLTDPIFEAAFMRSLVEFGEEARRVCLRCHAPMTMANGDWNLDREVTREGVGCDFCHTVKAVHLDGGSEPYTLEPGLVKRSVLRDASSPAHEVAYSELHGSAEFCGGCHSYVAPSGAALMSTYQEWKEGPYAREGVRCQDCHMALRSGNVVRPELGAGRAEFHVHDLIRDREQLQQALEVRVTRAVRDGTELTVEVEVENVGSGHMIPTGIPSREVVLTVEAGAGGRSWQRERRYRKVIADAEHRVLSHDAEILLRGAHVLNDNRIGPRETRRERFTFSVPERQRVQVSATASYVYAPLILKQEMVEVELGRAQRTVD